jgi:hypothetical protein
MFWFDDGLGSAWPHVHVSTLEDATAEQVVEEGRMNLTGRQLEYLKSVHVSEVSKLKKMKDK